jgi:hypothetical protein
MHSNAHLDLIDTSQTRNIIEGKRIQSFALSLENTKDLFGQDTQTTLALATYKHCFAENIKDPEQVFNATEGGIPIQGVSNLTLRELLMLYCRETIAFQDIFNKSHSSFKQNSRATIIYELQSLHDLYVELLKRLAELESRLVESAILSLDEKEMFVTTMKNTLRFLGEKPEAMQLLQGYAYAEFLQWRVAEKNSLANIKQSQEEFVLKEFNRDRDFLPALIESAEFLARSFQKLIEDAANI